MSQQLSQKQKVELGRMYYVLQGLTAKESASKVGVTEKTFGDWAEKFGWKALKAAEISKPERLIASLQDNIIQICDFARDENRPLNAKEADSIFKIRLTIRDIKKEYDIDIYNYVLQEFFTYTKSLDPDTARKGVDIADIFLRNKIQQLHG